MLGVSLWIMISVSSETNVHENKICKMPRQCLSVPFYGCRKLRHRGVNRLAQNAPTQRNYSGPGLLSLETVNCHAHLLSTGWLENAQGQALQAVGSSTFRQSFPPLILSRCTHFSTCLLPRAHSTIS